MNEPVKQNDSQDVLFSLPGGAVGLGIHTGHSGVCP